MLFVLYFTMRDSILCIILLVLLFQFYLIIVQQLIVISLLNIVSFNTFQAKTVRNINKPLFFYFNPISTMY